MDKTKPGYKTTEFWLTVAANLIGATLASGLVVEGSQLAQGLGLATVVLSNLGYTYTRAKVKTEEAHWRERGRMKASGD